MTNAEFLRAVRKIAEENGIDFFAAVECAADWSFQRDECPTLCALSEAFKAAQDAISSAGAQDSADAQNAATGG